MEEHKNYQDFLKRNEQDERTRAIEDMNNEGDEASKVIIYPKY
jgi:hypothetical protein